ncbi:MAG: DUF3187 family protein [Pseudomonadota bacterium]
MTPVPSQPPASGTPLATVSLGRRLRGRLFCLLSAVAALAFAAPVASGSPLDIRNTSPFAQPFGLLAPHGRLTRGPRLLVDVAAVNSFSGSLSAAGDLARLDGETAVYRLGAAWPLGDRWELAAELPLVVHSGGVFDGFIEEFHDLFGFPNGGRSSEAQDRLDYELIASGETRLALTERSDGIGDLRLRAARELFAGDAATLVARAQLKLPTGASDALRGSGATDLAVGLEYYRSLSNRLLMSAAAAATWLGRGDLWSEEQRRFVGQGHFGLALRLGRVVEFVGQLDAHSALYDAGPAQLGDGALLGTLGGRLHLSDRVGVEIAVVEDLAGAAVSDVTFRVGMTITGRTR